jgi:hypothetical protein
VLGEVEAGVVQAAVGFFPERTVVDAWTEARRRQPLPDATKGYQQVMAQWGARRLDGFAGAGRLASLAERVVEAVDPAGAPLFAAWRAVELPGEPIARAVQLAHLLREHRGAAHLVAVLACELRPIEAVVSGPFGEANARYFGWPPPYPEVSEEIARRRAEAEELTDRLAAPPYAVLDEAEMRELVELLGIAARGIRWPLG